MKLTDNGGGDFEQPEAGSYGATCYKIIDIGTQTGEYQGKQNSARKVIIGWQLDEPMKDGRAFVTASFYTASLNEKATLRKHLAAWRGRDFTEDELKGFDIRKLMGAPCLLSLTKNDKGKVKVTGISKLPKGMNAPALEPQNVEVYFSLDEFDQQVFDSLSDGIRKFILQSPEYQNIASNGHEADRVPNDVPNDDIPF